MVTLTIDGKEVTVKKSATIYEAAKEAGVYIPILCYHQKLMPFGACRICLVEVEQMKGRLIPACTTPVTAGMVVRTTNDEIVKVRKTVLEFLLVNHVIECPVCDKGGECELQDLTYEYGVVKNRFEGVKFDLETDEVNPLIERNMNRCVLCGKCVRVCDEVVGYGSYSFINRGFDTKIATAFDRGLNCEFCGQCVSVCPVGAILPRPFKFKARPWQLKQVDSVCGYCGNGCTVTLGTLGNKVETIRYNDTIGVNNGNLCVRGRFGYSYINSEERLTKPMLRKDGELVEVEWSEALAELQKRFKAAADKGSFGAIAGGRLTNEEYAALKGLVNGTLKSQNLDHSGGECYRGVTEGVQQVLGLSASTGTFPQVETADVILALGADLYETHPVFGMVMNQAIRFHGAELFVVGNKKAKLSKLPHSTSLLGKPGTEVDIINAICRVLLDENLAATEGIENLDALKSALAGSGVAEVAARTGVKAEAVQAAARALAKAKKGVVALAYGLPYEAQNKELAIAAANLTLLAGLADQEEGGLYLCGEKANSQGAIDLCVLPGQGALGARAMLQAAAKGNLEALYIIGENPVASYPDRAAVEAAIKSSCFVVVQDIFLSETAQLADLVLPAASFAEKNGTFTNAERRIQIVRSGVKSPGEAKTDLEILGKIAAKFGVVEPAKSAAELFAGLKGLNPAYAIEYSTIGPQGAVWGGEFLKPARKVATPVAAAAAPEGKYLLVTGSALYHCGTTSTKASGPNAVVSEPYIELSREDAKTLGIAEGDKITISAKGNKLSAKAKVGIRLPQGVVFAPYHFASFSLNSVCTGEAAVAVEVSK